MPKRRGQPVHGWVILDKPEGLSSAQAVGKVRRAFNAAKAGHAGTLDPLASGVLPIALGEATKTVSFAMAGAKGYRFTLRFGEERSTDDREGDVTAVSDARPSDAAVLAALPAFTGEIEQVPPAFSAIKVDGRRAYALARADQPVELAARPVRIDRLELVARPDADHAVFEVACGKGTYIRSLARDLARTLGTVGHVAALRRTRVGPFTEADAIPLDKLGASGHIAPSCEDLRPVETALDDIPALALTGPEAQRLRNGQAVAALPVISRQSISDLRPGATVCAMAEGKPVALARIEDGLIRPERVLNL